MHLQILFHCPYYSKIFVTHMVPTIIEDPDDIL